MDIPKFISGSFRVDKIAEKLQSSANDFLQHHEQQQQQQQQQYISEQYAI
jgi:hypothetical protein